MNTTQVYIGVTGDCLREAIRALEAATDKPQPSDEGIRTVKGTDILNKVDIVRGRPDYVYWGVS